MKTTIGRFVADEGGATAVEYAVVAGVIALALIAGLGAIRDGFNTTMNDAADGMK
jgi:pilus assembly protein Flp/PilA